MARFVPSRVVSLLDSMFPDVKRQLEGNIKIISVTHLHSDRLAALIDMVEQIPSELITTDVQKQNELFVSRSAIKNMIDLWSGGGRDMVLSTVKGLGDLNPVAMIRRALADCPDEFPSNDTAELDFIQDEEFRQSLRLDISSAKKHLAEGEWKSATVMAGSAVEALLLWVLIKKQQERPEKLVAAIENLKIKRGSELNNWHLDEFVQVSRHLGLVGEETTTQAGLTNNFRNLIHPGRVNQLGQKCDEATALAAAAAIQFVVRDLSSP